MKRIDFLVAGVQKAGTTSLDAYLRQHPGIAMAAKKEVHFFDKPPTTYVRAVDYALYHRNFDWAAQAREAKLGEATPIYTWWQGSLERIHAYHPSIKLIMILRDPVARAWSHHQMDVRLDRKHASFSEAIEEELKRLSEGGKRQDRVRSCISRGLYAPQIRKLKALFPPEQLLFLRAEDLLEQYNIVMSEVCKFLGVEDYAFQEEARHNGASHPVEVPPDDRAVLERYFADDAAQTRALLGWEKDGWCA